jgi:uncharacterized protein (DUF58 family)
VLTGTGRTFAALGVLLTAAGWVAGYSALVSLGVAFLLAMAAATIWVVRRPRVEASRVVTPERVTVGAGADSVLRIRNRSRRRTSAGMVLEGFGDALLPVSMPSLDPGAEETIVRRLPTDRRGVYRVGPLLVRRSDPFGLLHVRQEQRDAATLWVHPVVYDLPPLPSGLQRDLDGPDLGDAPEGGITFQNLREYVEGDDLRLVHWRSYARTGTLMVRRNIDSHQPRSLVILDTRAAVHDDETFEHAVTAAASVIAASIRRRFPFRFETTCGTGFDHATPRTAALDTFAALTRREDGSIEDTVRRVRTDPGGAALSLISGRCALDDLAPLTGLGSRFGSVTVARLGIHSAGVATLPAGALLINAEHAQAFARAWGRRVRRS